MLEEVPVAGGHPQRVIFKKSENEGREYVGKNVIGEQGRVKKGMKWVYLVV
jgi:hypothetical protein